MYRYWIRRLVACETRTIISNRNDATKYADKEDQNRNGSRKIL